MYQLYCGYGDMDKNNAIQYLINMFSVKKDGFTMVEKETGVDLTVYISKTHGGWGGRCASSEKCLSLRIVWNKNRYSDENVLKAIKWIRMHIQEYFKQDYVSCYFIHANYIPMN